MRPVLLPLCALSLLASAAPALANGEGIAVACNPNGAVLTLADGAKIYLGKSCDAVRPGVGEGRWWYAASALIVAIEGREGLRLTVEPECEALPYCRP